MRPNTTVAADQYLFRRRVFRNNSHPQAISPAPHRAGALANCGETAREWNAPGNLGPDDDLSRLRLNRRGGGDQFAVAECLAPAIIRRIAVHLKTT